VIKVTPNSITNLLLQWQRFISNWTIQASPRLMNAVMKVSWNSITNFLLQWQCLIKWLYLLEPRLTNAVIADTITGCSQQLSCATSSSTTLPDCQHEEEVGGIWTQLITSERHRSDNAGRLCTPRQQDGVEWLVDETRPIWWEKHWTTPGVATTSVPPVAAVAWRNTAGYTASLTGTH